MTKENLDKHLGLEQSQSLLQEDKYFTPSIEDIRVGYECEIWWNWNHIPENEWCFVKILVDDPKDFDIYDFISRIPKNEIRVPFLTKEQIETEGWRTSEPTPKATVHWKLFITKGNIIGGLLNDGRLELTLRDVLLDDRTDTTSNGRIYLGECKDINTFRYTCKLLGI